jgi:hypothetical protein
LSRRASFTQADVQRAVRALKAVGETVTGVDIRPDGSFTVLTGEKAAEQALSPYEAWERENGGRAA